MRVISAEKIKLDQPIQLYDIQNVAPYNNFVIGGHDYNYISHNCGLMDEVSFGQGTNIKKQKDKMMDTYHAVKARMKSRFVNYGGALPTVLFMVSSKQSDSDFLEEYITKIKNHPDVYVVDSPIWDVKPKGTYSGKTFKVGVGNKYLNSLVVEGEYTEEALLRQGYTIIEVPIEFRGDFDKDIERSLRDLAGISTTGSMKFVSGVRYKAVISDKKNPFKMDILTIGLDDQLQIKDFFEPYYIKESEYSRPIYIHIDTSLTGDMTGIAAVSIQGAKKRGYESYLMDDPEDDFKEIELHYRTLFAVGIKSPSDSEISLEKTRQFLYYLRDLGWNIKGVSVDGFQSADTRQILSKYFESKLLSLDRKPDGYMTFRAAINEGRIEIPNIPHLEKEILGLERDGQTGKIDHPSDNSKDMSDAVAGALWHASLGKHEYVFTYGEDLEATLDVSAGLSNERTRVIKDLEQMIIKDSVTTRSELQRQINALNNPLGETVNLTNLTPEQQSKLYKPVRDKIEGQKGDTILTSNDNAFVPSRLDDGVIVF